jgi:hypothetical protein
MGSQPLDSDILLALSALPDCGARDKVMSQIARLADRVREFEAAGNEVLDAYMPQFNDSRAVDNCLVRLAAVVANVKTTASDAAVLHDK